MTITNAEIESLVRGGQGRSGWDVAVSAFGVWICLVTGAGIALISILLAPQKTTEVIRVPVQVLVPGEKQVEVRVIKPLPTPVHVKVIPSDAQVKVEVHPPQKMKVDFPEELLVRMKEWPIIKQTIIDDHLSHWAILPPPKDENIQDSD